MNASQKNLLLIGITVAALAGAGVLFYRSSGGATSAPSTFAISGACLECSKMSRGTYALGEHEPYACPHCQKSALYPLYVCSDCQKRFVPQLVRAAPGEPWRLPHSPRCSACDSATVGAWDPELLPESELKGDLPLPKLGG
jgi:DNA-directed RNA polymerase subunit RPC12/RpoP